MLVRVLLLQGRDAEADEIARICEQIAHDHQLDVQIRCRTILGLVLARRGDVRRASDWPLRPLTWLTISTTSTRGPRRMSTWPRSYAPSELQPRVGAGEQRVCGP